jgi:hypothetical protein
MGLHLSKHRKGAPAGATRGQKQPRHGEAQLSSVPCARSHTFPSVTSPTGPTGAESVASKSDNRECIPGNARRNCVVAASCPRTEKDVGSGYPELKREAEEPAKPIIENETDQATRDQTAWIQPK